MLARLLLIFALVMQSLTVRPSCGEATLAPTAAAAELTTGKRPCCCGDDCTMNMPAAGDVASAACGCQGGETKPSNPAPASLQRGEQNAPLALLATPVALLALPACDVAPALSATQPMKVSACARHVIHCVWMI